MNKPIALLIAPGNAFAKELIAELKIDYEVHVVTRTPRPDLDANSEVILDLLDPFFESKLQQHVKPIADQLQLVILAPKFSPKGGLELNPSDLEQSYRINVTSLLMTLRTVSNVSKCCVIAIGGGYKDQPDSNKIALSSSKAALHNMIIAIQDECYERGTVLHELIVDGWIDASEIPPLQIVQAVLNLKDLTTPTVVTISSQT